jgi:hypothetical protein
MWRSWISSVTRPILRAAFSQGKCEWFERKRGGGFSPQPKCSQERKAEMKMNQSMLKLVALVLFVLSAILFFAQVRFDVDMGLLALGLAAWVAADVKM